jgi:G3E family GTPase
MSDTLVLVNEAGEAALDHLIVRHVAPGVAELANGCVCCTLRRDISAAVLERIEARDGGKMPPFSRIVIETSGLADPTELLATLADDPALEPRVCLDRVATLVDAVHGEATISDRFEATAQVAVADLLLLSKTDLAAPPEGLLDAIATANPTATVVDLAFAPALSPLLFGAVSRRFTANHGITATSFELRRAPTRLEFAREFGRFVAARGGDILRMKALIRFADAPDRVAAVHAVRHSLYPPTWLPGWPDDDARQRMVLIGKGIDFAELSAEIACLAPAPWVPARTASRLSA